MTTTAAYKVLGIALAVAWGACASRGGVDLRDPTCPVGVQSGTEFTATFLGTSSILFEDRRTAILGDPFVTRPRRSELLRIAPNRERVDATLKRLGITSVAAIFTGHSHYDHAMDAPMFAQRTGATLLGSESTVNIGRGFGLGKSQLDEIRPGDTRTYGDFELTFVESAHSPYDLAPGTITTPLVPPAISTAWKTGTTWSVLIRHADRSLLVHGSAGFKPGALNGRKAEVVYLSIGGLGLQSSGTIDQYWNEVVKSTGARRAILVHWDDFFRTLFEPLRPLRSPFDSFERAVNEITTRAARDQVDVHMPVSWQRTDPFAGLPRSGVDREGERDRGEGGIRCR